MEIGGGGGGIVNNFMIYMYTISHISTKWERHEYYQIGKRRNTSLCRKCVCVRQRLLDQHYQTRSDHNNNKKNKHNTQIMDEIRRIRIKRSR